MIVFLSIFSLIPFFILSLIYSGQFLILFFGYFLNLAVLLSQESIKSNKVFGYSSDQAFKYFVIDIFVMAVSNILIIFITKSLKNLSFKSLRLNDNFSLALKKYAFNKKQILYFTITQIFFIFYVLLASPDLSILSFNRTATISLTVPGIRYFYPFFLALSPALFTSSILSIITLRKKNISFLHYVLALFCLINIFLIGQRGFIFITIAVTFFSSFLFSIYRLLKGKLNISKFKTWLFILLVFPIIYNLRSLHVIDQKKLFTLNMGDLLPLKAWSGAIEVVKNNDSSLFTFSNNIFNFLSHQSRIKLGVPNSSDIINTFLFSDFYFDKGFGLNVTMPMDLYISLKGDWIWVFILLVYYTLVLYRFIKSTEYFLFKKYNLPSYLLITCAFSAILSGLARWPIALIFFIESHIIQYFDDKSNN